MSFPVSDRCYQQIAVDGSGTELAKYIATVCRAGIVSKRQCVPDEIPAIQVINR